MKHKTFDLYRCEAKEWQDMTYREALEVRVHLAKDAMIFYAELADAIGNKFQSESYVGLIRKFKDSEDAKNFNEALLKELE